MASTYDAVLTAIQSAVTGLNLTYSGTSLPVNVQKIERAEEGIDTLPCVVVVRGEGKPEEQKYYAFKTLKVKYAVDVAVIAPGNRDFSSTNLDTYLGWREQIRQLFRKPPLAGVSACFDLDAEPRELLPEEKANKNYDWFVVRVLVSTTEAG